MFMTPLKVVAEWLEKVKLARPKLDGKSICPFARMPSVVVLDKISEDKVLPTTQITIYIEDSINSTFDELHLLCRKLARKHKHFIFLPDHPHRKNYVKGLETGNGHLPVIIVQTKKELRTARGLLEKTNYYDYWDEEYLEEIKSYGI